MFDYYCWLMFVVGCTTLIQHKTNVSKIKNQSSVVWIPIVIGNDSVYTKVWLSRSSEMMLHVEKNVSCRGRWGTLKNPPCSMASSKEHRLTVFALHRQLWRLQMCKKFWLERDENQYARKTSHMLSLFKVKARNLHQEVRDNSISLSFV